MTKLKLDDHFTFLDSNISSTENDVNIHVAKAWAAIDTLSTLWKSDLLDKIKREFFRVVAVSVLLYG